MTHQVPPLPYAYTAREPHIDELTTHVHHDKHHAAYVTNLNAALESTPELQGHTVEALLRNIQALPEAVHTAGGSDPQVEGVCT